MAANTDYFTEVGNPGTATSLAAPGHSIGGTSITVGSTSNWPTTTGVVFAMDTVTLQSINGQTVEVRDPGSYTEWEGVVSSSTTVTSLVIRYGTDQNYPAGSTTRVYIPVASSRENRLVSGILEHADQDGTLKAGAVDNAAVLASNVVTTAKILDSNVTTAKIADSAVTEAKLAPATTAFRARRTTALNIGTGYTLIPFDTEDFDLGSVYDVTNGRFTAPINGYYEFRGVVTAGNVGRITVALYKNGSVYSYGNDGFVASGTGATIRSVITDLVYLNATDYIDLRAAADTSRPISLTENAFSGNIWRKA